MLRRSRVACVFMAAQFGPARMNGVPNNDNIDELLFFIKSARKLRNYFGSHFQRCPDRDGYYGAFGGPRGGRFTIRRTETKSQYKHHNATHGKWSIGHTNPTNPWSGVGDGGMYRGIWDNHVQGTNSFWDVTFKMGAKAIKKDNAIEWMENWGVKYKLLDEYTQPKMIDMQYTKHVLYASNFPWIKDPVTTAFKGDADYQWRGDEKYDYSAHGAKTSSVANEFRSLWGVKDSAFAKAAKQAAVATGAKSSAKKDAAKKSTPKKA